MFVPTGPTGSSAQYYDAAIAALRKGDYHYAITELRLGIHCHPKESKLHSLIGVAYFDQHEMLMARAHANLALKLNSENKVAQILDKALVDYGNDDDEQGDGPDPNSRIPRVPGGPWAPAGAAVDPYEVEIPIP